MGQSVGISAGMRVMYQTFHSSNEMSIRLSEPSRSRTSSVAATTPSMNASMSVAPGIQALRCDEIQFQSSLMSRATASGVVGTFEATLSGSFTFELVGPRKRAVSTAARFSAPIIRLRTCMASFSLELPLTTVAEFRSWKAPSLGSTQSMANPFA